MASLESVMLPSARVKVPTCVPDADVSTPHATVPVVVRFALPKSMASLESVMLPSARVKVPPMVTALVTANVLLSAVAPVTPSVPLSAAEVRVVAPDTFSVLLSAVAPVTPSVLPSVVAPDTSNVPVRTVFPVTATLPVTANACCPTSVVMHTRFPLVCSTHADTFKAPPVAQLVVSVVLSPTTRVLSTATCCTWQHTHALEVQGVDAHTIRYHGCGG